MSLTGRKKLNVFITVVSGIQPRVVPRNSGTDLFVDADQEYHTLQNTLKSCLVVEVSVFETNLGVAKSRGSPGGGEN